MTALFMKVLDLLCRSHLICVAVQVRSLTQIGEDEGGEHYAEPRHLDGGFVEVSQVSCMHTMAAQWKHDLHFCSNDTCQG